MLSELISSPVAPLPPPPISTKSLSRVVRIRLFPAEPFIRRIPFSVKPSGWIADRSCDRSTVLGSVYRSHVDRSSQSFPDPNALRQTRYPQLVNSPVQAIWVLDVKGL